MCRSDIYKNEKEATGATHRFAAARAERPEGSHTLDEHDVYFPILSPPYPNPDTPDLDGQNKDDRSEKAYLQAENHSSLQTKWQMGPPKPKAGENTRPAQKGKNTVSTKCSPNMRHVAQMGKLRQ